MWINPGSAQTLRSWQMRDAGKGLWEESVFESLIWSGSYEKSHISLMCQWNITESPGLIYVTGLNVTAFTGGFLRRDDFLFLISGESKKYVLKKNIVIVDMTIGYFCI